MWKVRERDEMYLQLRHQSLERKQEFARGTV